MMTTSRSELIVAFAAVIVSVTAASPGSCQQSRDSSTVRSAASPPRSGEREVRKHVVREGETLWQLAGAFLGDSERWKEIVELNPQLGAEPRGLEAGTVIRLPGQVRSRLILRVANGEAPIPSVSSEEIDERFQGRTVFFKARADSATSPAIPPARPDSSSR